MCTANCGYVDIDNEGCPNGQCNYCDNEICDVDTAHCIGCDVGRYGQLCEFTCPNCASSSTCDQSGNCSAGCTETFYGITCNISCSENCRTCVQTSGTCLSCKQGFFGSSCENTCSPYCALSGDGKVYCDKVSGDCNENDCIDGFYTPTCTTNCSSTCARQNDIPICDFLDGSCDLGCENGYHGPVCTEECSVRCLDKICSSATQCTTGCEAGFYGQGCESDCNPNCGGICYRNGTCTNECPFNKFGAACDLACNETCIDNTCDRDKGTCAACETIPNIRCRSSTCPLQTLFGTYCNTSCGYTQADGCPDSLCNFCKGLTCERYSGNCLSCQTGRYGGKCQYTCPNCVDEECTQSDGTCANGCKNGYYGAKCDEACLEHCKTCTNGTACTECVPGRFGTSCNSTCSDNCLKNSDGNIYCAQLTGTCGESACKVGWFGLTCEQPCSSTCERSSSAELECNYVDGDCPYGCEIGNYGFRCLETCSDSCKNKNCTNSLLCNVGCIDRYYGSDCQTTCNATCKDGLCDDTNGTCFDCENGYFGNWCEDTCFSDCLNDKCDRVEGVCLECNNLPNILCPHSECPVIGTYGDNCDDACGYSDDEGEGCLNGICNFCGQSYCHRYTGLCNNCTDGRWGELCKSKCPNCATGKCLQNTGTCPAGCNAGFYNSMCTGVCGYVDSNNEGCPNGQCNFCSGDVCDVVTAECIGCDIDRYGSFCEFTCPNCASGSTCDQSGNCTAGCDETFYGTTCNISCSKNCLTCDQTTGACLTCKQGFFGSSCENACSPYCAPSQTDGKVYCAKESGFCNENDCVDGFYTSTCSANCSSTCVKGNNRPLCHFLTGSCDLGCENGYHGSRCTQECSSRCLDAICSSASQCELGCEDGFYGQGCEFDCSPNCGGICYRNGTCSNECPHAKFGDSCDLNCNETCIDNTCDRKLGICLECNKTDPGVECRTANCSVGFWGSDCDSVCSSGVCPSGSSCFYCEGNTCERYTGKCLGCIIGRFGDECTSSCDNCVNGVCAQADGTCDATLGCDAGWYGTGCTKACHEPCTTCNRNTGVCDTCNPSYYGPNCTLSCSSFCVSSSGGDIRCDKDSGNCLEEACLPGHYGRKCDQPCNQNCARSSNDCHFLNGSCIDGCDNTFFGPMCEDSCSTNCLDGTCLDEFDNCVKGCIDGKYGNKCDQDCSVNCNGDFCERNGKCIFGCNVGWYANMCDSRCEPNKTCIDETCHRLLGYCEECDKTNRNYTCREADCPAGFSGEDCTTPCSTGVKVAHCRDNLCERYNDGRCIGCEASYYGFKCDISCNGCIDGECSQDNGTCARGCQDRWYGNLCDVSCPDNCVKCNRDTGACLVCDLGYWGPNCGFTCSQKCKDTIIGGTSVIKCDKDNGHCEDQTACKPNYFGPKCDQNCSTNCVQTNGNNVCNITNGACAAGCITGWFADDCRSKCNDNCLNKNCAGSATNCLQGCIPTYTGDDCQSRCNDKCVNDLCARNGYCSSGCEDGFYTDDCSRGCDPNFACNDGTCDRNNGLCTECDLTNPGPNCPTANCTRGKWGLTCEQDCPSNCLYELCNRTTGKCRGCKKGFYGNACTSNCTNCLDIGIEALCVQDTAVCVSGCIPGYWKLTCTESCDADCATCDRDTSACTTCRPSRHGILCDQDCNNGCTLSGDGNRYCDKLDGSCIPAGVCVDGFWGVSCQDSCNENCAKENGVLRCRNTDGTCTSGCEPTWFGNTCIDRCSTRCKNRLCSGVADNCLQGCADGFYGSNRCNSVCSSNCANTGCDPITGECDDQGCRTGFWDLRCDKPCIYPCIDTTCNRETGSCLDCGLEIPGPQCPNISCPIGYYTSTCNVVCPTANCKGGICDRKSGNCSTGCKDGFFGETCSENCQCRSPGTKACLQTGQCECNSGYYGPNCEFECSDGCVGTTCDADTGECTCRSGRYGSRCELICDKCTNENCNADNGNCNEGCKANHWGLQCTADCPTNCETCTQLEGQCITCMGAFHGAVCESSCSSYCVAVNNVRACEKSNGRCSAGCEDSWFGSQCNEQCLTCASDSCNREGVCTLGCKAGQYGSMCDRECGTNCVKTSGISICDRDTGECVNGCEAGWFGPDCGQQCNALCKDQLCTGTSDNCDNGCIDGRYGAGCSQACSTNCLNGKCSNIGVCSEGCEKTFYGGKCNVACRELCTDNTCNQDTGDCEDCATANKGPLCPVDATTPAPTAEKGELTVPQIIGICVGGTAAVILIIVLIIVCLWQTRRTSRLEKTASAIYTPEMLETLSRFSHKSSQPGYYTPRGPPTSSLYHQTEISYGGPVPMKGQPPLDDWEDTSPLAVTDFSSESSLTEAKDLMDGGLDNVHIVDYTDTVSRSIKVGELLRYIETALKYDRLAEEYKSLQSGLRHPHDFGKTSQNADKNRYKDIVPYDKNRVVLKMRDSSGSDYINASYIHGFHNKREFIASQGPTESTVTEFLQMLWQEDCGKLVTLTNVIEGGMRKCFQFWPEVDKRLSFGSFLITNQEETKYAMFVVRKLQLEMNKSDRRRITHFHFTSWPDQGIPNDVMPLVELHHKVKNSGAYGMGPTVVHCSAGIGRTGTYIALDFLVDQALLTESLDILKAVDRLREQRVNMVQTPDQYEFLYKAVAAAVLTNKSRVHFTGFHSYCRSLLQRDAFSSESPLHQQFEILQRLSRVLGYEGDCITAKLPENVDKNRDMNILANDDNRPYLSTQVPGTTDYINAIFVPSYLNRFGYIVTQMPLSNTIPDFWRLVYDHDVRTIVMLNDVASFEQDRTFYWPNLRGETKLGPFTIESVDETHGDNYGTSTLMMKFASKQKNDARTVKLFRCSCWPANSPTPSTPQAFLDLVMDVKSWQEQFREDPIVVHCINGAERSGLFCALATNIERLEADRELSVMSTVHQMKAKRPQLMDDPDQYGFCYKTVLAHLEKTHL